MSGENILPASPPVVLSGTGAPVVDPGGSGANAGVVYDWLIDGIGFLLWPSDDDPYLRDTKEDVKEQFDSSREAGEQSFGYWWLRSQATYHGGAGQNYLDTDQAEISRTRYYTSNWLNPWTQGQLSVNPTFSTVATSVSSAVQATWSGTQVLAAISSTDNNLRVWNLPDMTSPQTYAIGSAGICQAIATDGENIFVAVDDKVYKVPPGGTETLIANVTFSGPVVMGYAKQRVILCTGPKVFQIDATGGTLNPTAFYTAPSSNWQYTAVADGPNGIYLAGYLGPLSELALITVQDAGSGITLSQPVVQLRTPPSEIIWDVAFYLNAFFGLATSNGIRVGQFTPYGQPQYGPLLNPGNPCYSVTGSGSLLYVGGARCIWSVDLGTQVAEGRYAHALYGNLLGATGDNIVSIEAGVFTAGERLFAVTSSSADVLYQPATVTYPAAGTLTTSWARFSTTEPKRMHYVRVEGNFPVPSSGSALAVAVEAITGETVTVNLPGGAPFYEFGVSSSFATAEAFRLVLSFPATTTMRSWQIKARPCPTQFQEFILPLGCWDRETAADGQEVGYPGYAMDRLRMLEAAAKSNRVLTLVDRWSNSQIQATVSRCQFRQTVLPGRTGRDGGKVTLILRLMS